jgi:hypothetical protein
MDQFDEQQVAQVLNEANGCPCTAWELCRYSKASGALVLCSADSSGSSSTYLIFRKPQLVRLPWRVEGPQFVIDRSHGSEAAGVPPAALPAGRHHRILVRSQGRDFYIVCQGVAFYQVAEDGEIDAIE